MSENNLFFVKIGTPLGNIEGQVEVDSNPMHLAELVPMAVDITNIMVERALNIVRGEGKKVSCGPGCGACCNQMVPVSPPEAFFLVDLMASMNGDLQTALIRRFENAVQILRKQDMIDEAMDPTLSDDHFLPVARKYFGLQIPCPFLEEESCSIHPHRPVACRDYNVTSPPSLCADPYKNDVEKVSMPIPLSIFLARLTAKLTGWKPHLIPLTLVPQWVSENRDLKAGRWPGRELFQQFMSLIGAPPSSATGEKQPG